MNLNFKITLALLVFFISITSSTRSSAQSLYDLNTIQEIKITFEEDNWDQLLDDAYSTTEDYILAASVSINGSVYDSIGVKYKGNSTYNRNQVKNPFHIELDTYKDHEHQGYTDIKLSNAAKDPSFLREVLSYDIIRKYMDTPLSNYANVYVNGELIGLYSNSESISKKFVKNRFGSKNNTFIKCNPPAGAGPQSNDLPNLVYLGRDSSDYYNAYELKSDHGWAELINLCDTLKNATEAIEKILDVDRTLWMLALDNVLVNLDSYIGGFAQNYYLYRDDYGRFLPVIWDLNESFGRFSRTGTGNLNGTTSKQRMSHLLNQNDADFPLVQELLANPQYKKMYIAHFKTILEENFESGTYLETGMNLQTLIDASVAADNNKFFTYNNFISNLNSDINSGGGPSGGSTPGIVNLMEGRTDYMLNLTDFTTSAPSLETITSSASNPSIGEDFTISIEANGANLVVLNYRFETGAPFQKIEMNDNGISGDANANDQIYTAPLNMENGTIEFYIYAENEEAGIFNPERAAHEFHTIEAGGSIGISGDLVINEFLASNDSETADQDGEFDDWIELFNNTNETIDLSNYTLSDDASELDQWTFPDGTTISGQGYLTLWADNDEEQEGLHCNFKISASGESLFLSNAEGNVIDEITFPNQTTDISFGRFPNGTGDFTSLQPTFNFENQLLTSTESLSLENDKISLYPNPCHDYLNISSISQDERSILVSDVLGNILFMGIIKGSLELNTSDWSAGTYFVTIENRTSKFMLLK